MDWDEVHQPGRTWRVRVRLADRPGQLATLAVRLSDQQCNLLGVTVLPTAGEPSGAAGDVVDELVLRAPDVLGPAELRRLVEMPGATCVGVAPASVADLVDAQTAALRAASSAVSGAATTLEALRHILTADTVAVVGGEAPAASAPGSTHLDLAGHRATICAAGGERVLVERGWAPFTEGELARVTALLDLVELARAPAVPPSAPPAAVRSRRQLSSLDVQFLNAETSTTSTHIGGLTILDPSDVPGEQVTVSELRKLVKSRLPLVAPLRWRLHQVPLGLDLPYWVDAGTVDLEHHIREVHLPSPGTDEQLGEQIAALAETPLDRDHPLWECYLVHGLSGGRQALYTKVHHAVIDGVSAAEVLAIVFDLEPRPRRVRSPSDPPPESPPSAVEMLQRGVRRNAFAAMRVLRTAPRLPRVLSAMRPAAPPRTPFNGPITARRSYAFTSIPLDEVKAVKNALGLTVNDVVMALCTSALRRWLIDHDALPDHPLIASIPVSVRTKEQIGTAGNQISFMLTEVPTDEADPKRRVELLHTSLIQAKRRFLTLPRTVLHDASAAFPQALHGVVPRLLLRAASVAAPPFNLLVSNVAGPQIPLYAVGAKVVGNFPVSVVSDISGGINITVMSYNGHLDMGILACHDMVPDVWRIADYLRDALTELDELAVPESLSAVLAGEAV
ncbi:MAG: Acyltransferase [Pseudonocardiales bacterium]|nr:Acyltransferase [Pseudonocardiales bacterium]